MSILSLLIIELGFPPLGVIILWIIGSNKIGLFKKSPFEGSLQIASSLGINLASLWLPKSPEVLDLSVFLSLYKSARPLRLASKR